MHKFMLYQCTLTEDAVGKRSSAERIDKIINKQHRRNIAPKQTQGSQLNGQKTDLRVTSGVNLLLH
jgi:hypothetical protein